MTPQKIDGAPQKIDGAPQKVDGAPQKIDGAPQKTSERIVSFMLKNQKVTRKELAVLLAVSEDAIKQHIARLVSAGRIRRVGPDKGGYWEVLKP